MLTGVPIVKDYYGEQVEDFFNQRREHQRKNLRDHESEVAKVIGEPVDILTKPERAGPIERWAEVAADVPLVRIQFHGVIGQEPRLIDVGLLCKALRDRKHQPGRGNHHPDQVPKLDHANLFSLARIYHRLPNH